MSGPALGLCCQHGIWHLEEQGIEKAGVGCVHDGWARCGTQWSRGESGQRRVWVGGKAGEDPGKVGKLERGLERDWWPGKAWPYLRKAGEGFFVCFCFCHLKISQRGFPGGAVVENLPANAGDTGSSPGLGRSHMPRSN